MINIINNFKIPKNILEKTKQLVFSTSQQERLETEQIKEELSILRKDVKDLIDSTILNRSLNNEELKEIMKRKTMLEKANQKEISVIVEYLHEIKKTIYNDKSDSLNQNIQTTNSLQTLEVVLTSRGEALKPF